MKSICYISLYLPHSDCCTRLRPLLRKNRPRYQTRRRSSLHQSCCIHCPSSGGTFMPPRQTLLHTGCSRSNRHPQVTVITYASPLSSAAIRPDPNSLPSPVEQKQGTAASQAISVAAQYFTYAALLILCSCDRTGQVKDFKFNSSETCKSKDHHSLTPMPGFSLAYLGYKEPGNSAGNMTALLPDWNSEAIPMMQRVLIQSSNAKINLSHNSDSVRATPKTGIRMWGLWKERFQAVQSEEHISTEAKNSARAALAQMVKVEMLSKTDRQE